MHLKGKVTWAVNSATSPEIGDEVAVFNATTSVIHGDERPVDESHELTNLIETDDQGVYTCIDTHGREWTLTDREGDAELFPNF